MEARAAAPASSTDATAIRRFSVEAIFERATPPFDSGDLANLPPRKVQRLAAALVN
ncbi:hypothetical protein [Roseiarcus fermentans]|uniref:hypothetical protein n=1 Tax=Roseiarcus fermentans TaxID=1473586 RepID=UPI0014760001|nr:hypothetical protein [Roseiarcus fermentans]